MIYRNKHMREGFSSKKMIWFFFQFFYEFLVSEFKIKYSQELSYANEFTTN